MNALPREPVWLTVPLILAVHDRQLAEHGGAAGIRDQGALESALARPINRWHYGEQEHAALASSYAFGIARNYPLTDGNKRTAWVAARLFLRESGLALAFTEEDAVKVVLALAAGDLSEDELADWLRQRLAPAG